MISNTMSSKPVDVHTQTKTTVSAESNACPLLTAPRMGGGQNNGP